MAAPTATVLRDGQEMEIPARDLVPGDVMLLRAGDRVPADVRLMESVNLQIEEAALTGESVAVEKHAAPLPNAELALGDRKNMAYAGTAATYGRGRGLVVATGMNTEFGKIAQMLQAVETGKTPLQENLDRVGRTLAKAAFVIVAVIVAVGLFRGQPFIEMLVFGIALAVAVVPEALPAVVTISLAIGVQRMVKRHALVRRLLAVETLGQHLGHLLRQDRHVDERRDDGPQDSGGRAAAGRLRGWLRAHGPVLAGRRGRGTLARHCDGCCRPPCSLPTRKSFAATPTAAGTSKATRRRARWSSPPPKPGWTRSQLESQFPRVDEIPFTSETKRMTTLHDGPEGTRRLFQGCAGDHPRLVRPAIDCGR